MMVRRRVNPTDQLPEVALRLSRSIRAGVPIESSIVQVDNDMGHQHRSIRIAASQLSAGRPLAEVQRDWSDHSSSDAERLLVGVLELGITAGADLGSALDSVGEAMRDDIDHDKRRRILLTQNQLSAAVLVLLPIVFALLASLTNGFVYGSRVGVIFLFGGVFFDLCGLFWIKRLLARLR